MAFDIATRVINVDSWGASAKYRYQTRITINSISSTSAELLLRFWVAPNTSGYYYSQWSDTDAHFYVTPSSGSQTDYYSASGIRGQKSLPSSGTSYTLIASHTVTVPRESDGHLNVTFSVVYGWGSGTNYLPKQTTITMTAAICPRLTFNANGGSVSPASQVLQYGQTYTNLPTPTRTGYDFHGWFANCQGTAATAVKMGNRYKFALPISIHANVYSTNWSARSQDAFISCTQGGGWSCGGWTTQNWFAEIYDSGSSSYKDIVSSTAWSALAAGHHTLDIIVDSSKKATFYIDGASKGSVTLSGGIGYHAQNGIMVGGEAEEDTWTTQSAATSGSTNHLATAYIGNVSIQNNATRITNDKNTWTAPAEDKTLYALWSPKTITVTYVSNGTTLGTSTHTYGATSSLKTMSTLGGSLSGYTFYGWATANNTVTRSYTDGQSASNIANNVTLHAIWKRTATFYSGENKATSATSTLYRNTNTYSVAIPSAPAGITNWTTLGWRNDTTADAKEYNTTGTITGSSATTYYAVYSRSATFYSGTNKATSATATQYHTSAGTSASYYRIPSPPTPAAISGWTALGWRRVTSAGDASWTTGTVITGNYQTFYGAYSRTATFYYGLSKASNTTATQYYNSNNAYSVTTPTVTSDIGNGWSALGWRDDTTANNRETAMGSSSSSSSVNFYMVYSRTLTINYNANGGSGSTNATTATQYYNTNPTISTPTFTLAANGFSKKGYNFSKWADGSTSGTQYSASSSYTAWAPAVNTATITKTMYAIWAAGTFTLTFNANGGSVSQSTKTVTYGTAYTDLPKATRPGYKFNGWFVNCANVASTAVNFGTAYMYVSTLNVHFVTYSTDYSDWGSYRMISCTQSGGWNIEDNGSGYPRFAVYDETANAYKHCVFTKKWADLTPGFHQWDIILSSKVITVYIDNAQAGTLTLSGNNIKYNTATSIFVGGEAGENATDAVSPYLNGYVGNLVISNSTTRIGYLGRQRFIAPAQNVTLYALWEPYFNVYIKGKSSGWVLLKDGHNWQN